MILYITQQFTIFLIKHIMLRLLNKMNWCGQNTIIYLKLSKLFDLSLNYQYFYGECILKTKVSWQKLYTNTMT
uniref:Uncharacterized protein n=1 Tax=Kalanchoe fedtschenkoi TaxID=63787 RepID=A0A7N1A1A1_KALFE